MKAIKTSAVIFSIRSKMDKSLSLTVHTPETTSVEKAAFMDLQGINVELFVRPLDEAPQEIVNVDKDVEAKSQSQRLRGVLFVLWDQQGRDGKFEDFYYNQTERIIEAYKAKLDS